MSGLDSNVNYLQEFYKHIIDGVIILDQNFKIIHINKMVIKTFEYSEDELIGNELSLLLPESVKSKHNSYVKKFQDSNYHHKTMGERDVNLFGISKTNKKIPLDVTISKIVINGELCFLAIIRDISEKIQMLNESIVFRKRYHSFFKGSQSAIVLMKGTKFYDVNKKALKLFGKKERKDFFSLDIKDVVPEFQSDGSNSVEAAHSHIKKALSTGSHKFYFDLKKDSGEIFKTKISLARIKFAQDEVLEAILEDVSKILEKERNLIEGKIKSDEAALRFEKTNVVLLSITKILSSYIKSEHSGNIFEEILSEIIKITDSEYGFIGEVYYKNNQPVLLTKALTDISWDETSKEVYLQHLKGGIEFSKLNTLYGEVLKTKKVYISNNPSKDKNSYGVPKGHLRMDSFCGIPLIKNDNFVGMIGISNRPFGYDLEILEELKLFIITTTQILTDTKIRERQLILQEETINIAKELRQFIETANAPIFGIDERGKVNEWNQAAETITKFSKEEVLGKDLVETYITEDYRESVKNVLDDALKGKGTANYEFPLFTKDNRRVMVLLNSTTRRNAKGNIVGVLGVGQDISDIDKYRSETEAVAKELRQFIETANAPIFGIDERGKVNEWNQAAETITKFSKEEVLGKDLVETYITEDYRESVKTVLDNALKGKGTANYEFPLFTKDNRRVMVLLNSTTRRDVEGNIIGVLGVGQDITELADYKENLESRVKLRTQELEESLEREKELGILKTNFVSMASHEFRTPLAAIRATTEVIQRYSKKLTEDDINKRLTKIKKEVDEMTFLLEDILIIGKAQSQKLEFNPEVLNLNEKVQQIIGEYQLGLSKHRNILVFKSDEDFSVKADLRWLKHIITNLLSNAIKYSEDDKPVELYLKKDSKNIVLTCKDYGIGIHEKDLKRLFEPFHRGINVGNISGTGLGLAVLLQAVELHQGTIDVQSQIGSGTTFIVTLPI